MRGACIHIYRWRTYSSKTLSDVLKVTHLVRPAWWWSPDFFNHYPMLGESVGHQALVVIYSWMETESWRHVAVQEHMWKPFWCSLYKAAWSTGKLQAVTASPEGHGRKQETLSSEMCKQCIQTPILSRKVKSCLSLKRNPSTFPSYNLKEIWCHYIKS